MIQIKFLQYHYCPNKALKLQDDKVIPMNFGKVET